MTATNSLDLLNRAPVGWESIAPPPVEKLFWLSIKSFFIHFKSLLVISLFPAVLLGGGAFAGAVAYFGYTYFVSEFGLPLPASSIYAEGAGYGVFLLFCLPAETLFLTVWYRAVLLEERDSLLRASFTWRRRHWVVLVRLLFLSLAFSALGYLLWALYWDSTIARIYYSIIRSGSVYPGYILLGILGLLIAGVLMRFSNTLPAAAIGKPYSLWQSWRETRGQGLRLSASVALLSILFCGFFGTIFVGFTYSLITNSIETAPELYQMVALFLIFAIVSFSTLFAQAPIFAVIAHSFRLNSGWSPDEEAIARFE